MAEQRDHDQNQQEERQANKRLRIPQLEERAPRAIVAARSPDGTQHECLEIRSCHTDSFQHGMCRSSPRAQRAYTVFVDTGKHAATSRTLNSVRNLSADSSANGAKTCHSVESTRAVVKAKRTVANRC
jgi:hypothetical protein